MSLLRGMEILVFRLSGSCQTDDLELGVGRSRSRSPQKVSLQVQTEGVHR